MKNERWLAFRSHYGLDAFYCLPGKAGAHENADRIPAFVAGGRINT